MNARNINAKAKRVRRIKKTARLRTAIGSLGNPNFRNVRRRGRHT